jgi:DNA polymerase
MDDGFVPWEDWIEKTREYGGTRAEWEKIYGTHSRVEWLPEGADCEKCGLREQCNGPVPDDGGDYSILVVGESPGADEDEAGRPFIGRSGQLLRSALEQVGYAKKHLTFTNVVKCHPPGNNTKMKYVRCCYQSLPIKENTRLVLLCGNVPLKAVLGESGITTWNGVRVERDGVIYAPVMHPAYLLRNQDRNTMDQWLKALDDALYAFDNGARKRADDGYEYVYPETLAEIEEMIVDLECSDAISFDTEFSYLDAFHEKNKINVISFANGEKAWALPLQHPNLSTEAALLHEEYTEHWIRELLQNHPYVIGHNVKMDQMQIDDVLGISFDAAGDTMLASYLVDTSRGIHSLKRLAGYYLGMFEYDQELQDYVNEHKECDPRRGGSYENVPLETLLPYAARDAAATYLLEMILIKKMTDEQVDLYYELMVPVSNALYRMQLNGMAVDTEVSDRLRRLYRTAMSETEQAIQDDLMVQKYASVRREEDPDYTFNPNSYVQRGAVLYDYYSLEPLEYTDTGNPSTARDTLNSVSTFCTTMPMSTGKPPAGISRPTA